MIYHNEDNKLKDRTMESKEFEWPFEISGFGGGYEKACRDMAKAGVLWLREHPGELDKWLACEKEYKKQNATDHWPLHRRPKTYKNFEGAIIAACNDSTGAMFGAAKSHAIAIFEKGWNEYVRYVLEARKEDK